MFELCVTVNANHNYLWSPEIFAFSFMPHFCSNAKCKCGSHCLLHHISIQYIYIYIYIYIHSMFHIPNRDRTWIISGLILKTILEIICDTVQTMSVKLTCLAFYQNTHWFFKIIWMITMKFNSFYNMTKHFAHYSNIVKWTRIHCDIFSQIEIQIYQKVDLIQISSTINLIQYLLRWFIIFIACSCID